MSVHDSKYHSLSIAYNGFFASPTEQLKHQDNTFVSELAPDFNTTAVIPANTPVAPASAAPAAAAKPSQETTVNADANTGSGTAQGVALTHSARQPQPFPLGTANNGGNDAVVLSKTEFGALCFVAGIAVTFSILHFSEKRRSALPSPVIV